MDANGQPLWPVSQVSEFTTASVVTEEDRGRGQCSSTRTGTGAFDPVELNANDGWQWVLLPILANWFVDTKASSIEML